VKLSFKFFKLNAASLVIFFCLFLCFGNKVCWGQVVEPVVQPISSTQTEETKPHVLALENLSKSIRSIHQAAAEFVQDIRSGEEQLAQLALQLKNPDTRHIVRTIILKCLAVIIFSYGFFLLSSQLMLKLYRWQSVLHIHNFGLKILNLFALWLLNLLPIAIFAGVAYSTLIFLKLAEPVQWVLLAWISAFIIVKTLLTLYNFIIALFEMFPVLLILDEPSVIFLRKWLALITAIGVYGYFILQTAYLLGISTETYKIISNLLGLIVLTALVVMTIRSPLQVVELLANKTPLRKKVLSKDRISWIEAMWRTIAVVYLLLLYLVWTMQANNFFWFVLKNTFFSLILIFLAIKIIYGFRHYLNKDLNLRPGLKKRLPGLEHRLKNYRRALDIFSRGFIYTLIGIVILKFWGGGVFNDWFPYSMREIIIIKLISILCILFISLVIWEICNSLIEISLTKGGEDITVPSGRAHTLLTIARKTLFFSLSLIAALMILSELGINIAPLLAGAGVLGLAISFGGQKLVQDIITGFFMLLENQVAVGDVVTIGDKSGSVEVLSIRTIRLRDLSGAVHIIPYSSIAIISNLTKDFSYALFEINVAYRENVDEVIKVLRQIAADLQADLEYKSLILEPLDILGLDKFAESAVIIKARLKTKPTSRWRVAREFNRRMKQKFDELNIQIPFPHTVLLFGGRV